MIFYGASVIANGVSAGECMGRKKLPSLEIKDRKFSVSVVQPDEMVVPEGVGMLHGNVVATFSEGYEIEYGAERAGRGWCIFIEHIAAVIGYTDFVIQIDKRHRFDSCEWAAIKDHEDEHIRAHLSVISDNRGEIKRAITDASAAMAPVFAADESGIDAAMDKLEKELASRPEIRLMRQKIAAEQEIKNKRVDQNDKGERIRRCAE